MRINIYGDSIMKGAVLTPTGSYRAAMGEHVQAFEAASGHQVLNRSRFGSTIGHGLRLLERDLAKGTGCDYALVEFGGNDCDFDWLAVARDPQSEHQPHTPMAQFEETYRRFIARLRSAGVTPVAMTLPPLDAERYLSHIGRTADRGNVLRWLGDAQMIYRFHELYSQRVAALAQEAGVWLIDVRQRFLSQHSFCRLIGQDGIHLSAEGYQWLAQLLAGFAASKAAPQPSGATALGLSGT